MKNTTNKIDFKRIIRFIIGAIMSVFSGWVVRAIYVAPFIQKGNVLQDIDPTMMFFWTLIGVGIGFVLGFYILFFFIDILVKSYSQIRMRISGMTHTKSYVLDSSAILDGRIAELVKLGLFPSWFYVSSVTMDELKRLERVSSVYARRVEKAKKIMDRLSHLLKKKMKIVSFVEPPKSIRDHILSLAKMTKSTIITLDVNLTDEARAHGIPVININELALAFRLQLVPGDILELHLNRPGKEKNQAVGYLDDGMMVIVENGIHHLHKNVEVECVSVLQSTAGKIVFGKFVRELDEPS
ncbi:MAG: hypothetical protein PHI40_03975 [Caldisericia bacterium]|nr:hypothetical protein [Caldisericia bacterium]MDD4614553.1 hypothetical protein [Caldisericia bacterium]